MTVTFTPSPEATSEPYTPTETPTAQTTETLTPSLTASLTSSPTVQSGMPIVGELTFAQPVNPQTQSDNTSFSLFSLESQYLTFVEDFDDTPLEFWQRRPNLDAQGSPIPLLEVPTVSGQFVGNVIAARHTSATPSVIHLQADILLSDQPGETFHLTALSWQFGIYYVQFPENLYGDNFRVYAEIKDVNGTVVYSSPICQFTFLENTPVDCSEMNAALANLDVADAHSITVVFETSHPVSSIGSGTSKDLIMDNFTVITDQVVLPPTPTPTITPTPEPDLCEGLDIIRDENGLIGAVDELITAIDEANALPLDQTTTFCLDPAETYSIEQPSGDFFGATGLPPITGNLTILGRGATIERSPFTNDTFRIFAVAETGNLTLQDVTVQGGLLDVNGGAGILITGGQVHLDNATITDNHTTNPNEGEGGGIYNFFGSLTMVNESEVTNNTSSTRGGGIFNWGGGGLGVTQITSSRIADNFAPIGGGGIYNNEGLVQITSSVLRDNGTDGGGRHIVSNSATAVTYSCLLNTTTNYGIAVENLIDTPLNATRNWWGRPEGPLAGVSGDFDSIDPTRVTYQPFVDEFPGCELPEPVPTELVCPAPNSSLFAVQQSQTSDDPNCPEVTPEPSPTLPPTPTPTETPIPPICIASVNATPDFGVHSMPSLGSPTLVRLPNLTPLTLLGQSRPNVGDYIWYKAEYSVNGSSGVGWLRGDGVKINDCSDLPILDPNTNMPVSALHDYELSETPPQEWESLTCTDGANYTTDDEKKENWIRCARVVYYAFYQRFWAVNHRNPRVSDVLAAVFYGELKDVAFSKEVPVGINTRNGIPVDLIAAETIASNYWSVVYETGGDNLSVATLTGNYLVQVQSWYQQAIPGREDESIIDERLILRPVLYHYAAWDILSQRWLVNNETVKQWGNIPFGTNTGYNSLYTNNQVAYCYTVREFRDGDGDINTVSRQSDYWNDYRFVFIVGTSLGAGYIIDTYNQFSYPAPKWLVEVNADGSTFYRNTDVDPIQTDPNAGRIFMDCSLVVDPAEGL